VPETLSLACDIIHEVAPDLMDNPTESACRSLGVVYGDVKQRWVVIYSPEARQRVLKSVNKHCLKQSTAEFKVFDTLCKQDFAWETDARKALVQRPVSSYKKVVLHNTVELGEMIPNNANKQLL